MKKVTTTYISELKVSANYETLEVNINEEHPEDIKISFNTEFWRTREETVNLLNEIIEKIKTI